MGAFPLCRTHDAAHLADGIHWEIIDSVEEIALRSLEIHSQCSKYSAQVICISLGKVKKSNKICKFYSLANGRRHKKMSVINDKIAQTTDKTIIQNEISLSALLFF